MTQLPDDLKQKIRNEALDKVMGWVNPANIFEAGAEYLHSLQLEGQSRWVKCSERLPEQKEGWNHSKQCLVWYEPDCFGISYYHWLPPFKSNGEWVDFGHYGKQPLFWMPLPLPPGESSAPEGKDGVFNEQSLRNEIIKVWGEYGAHIDVYDSILNKLKDATTCVASSIPYPEEGKDKGEAVEFAEWLSKSGYDSYQITLPESRWSQQKNKAGITTSEAYQLFKQNKGR